MVPKLCFAVLSRHHPAGDGGKIGGGSIDDDSSWFRSSALQFWTAIMVARLAVAVVRMIVYGSEVPALQFWAAITPMVMVVISVGSEVFGEAPCGAVSGPDAGPPFVSPSSRR